MKNNTGYHFETTEFCNDYALEGNRTSRHNDDQYITDLYCTAYTHLSGVWGEGELTDRLLDRYINAGRDQYREEYPEYIKDFN